MTPLLIMLIVVAILYVGLNVRRLSRGRRWAFTFCQVAKEWDERERAKLRARRNSSRVGS